MTSSDHVHIDDHDDRLTFTLKLDGREAGRVWSWFTDADALMQWWPEEAALDLVVGGEYTFRWTGPGWTLRGEYLEIEPGRRLTFSWRWDHEERPARIVTAEFGEDALTVSHTYGDSDERDGYVEGWTHFLGRLWELTR